MEEVCLEVYLVLVVMDQPVLSQSLRARFEICKGRAAWFLLLQVLGVSFPVLAHFVCHFWNLHDPDMVDLNIFPSSQRKSI